MIAATRSLPLESSARSDGAPPGLSPTGWPLLSTGISRGRFEQRRNRKAGGCRSAERPRRWRPERRQGIKKGPSFRPALYLPCRSAYGLAGFELLLLVAAITPPATASSARPPTM